MRLRAIHSLILVLILGAVTFGRAPEPGFDEYVTNAMKEWEVPGLAIAIVKDDKIVFVKGYGVREIGAPAPGPVSSN